MLKVYYVIKCFNVFKFLPLSRIVSINCFEVQYLQGNTFNSTVNVV